LKIVRDSAIVNGIKTRDCGSDNEELRPKLLIRTYANLSGIDSFFFFDRRRHKNESSPRMGRWSVTRTCIEYNRFLYHVDSVHQKSTRISLNLIKIILCIIFSRIIFFMH